MTKPTIWDIFTGSRVRYSTLLLIGGGVGLLLMAFILKVPVGVSILIAIFLGSAGIAGAVLEMIVKAVAAARAPITFRPREPYEFVKLTNGHINVAHITYVHLHSNGNVTISQTDQEPMTLEGDDAVCFANYMDEISTPIRPTPHA